MAWPDTNQFGNCHERETSPGLKFIHSTNKNSSIVYQFDSKYWKLAGRKLFKYHQHAGQEPTHVDCKIENRGKKNACCMECVYHYTNEHNKHVFMTLKMKLIKFLIWSLYLFCFILKMIFQTRSDFHASHKGHKNNTCTLPIYIGYTNTENIRLYRGTDRNSDCSWRCVYTARRKKTTELAMRVYKCQLRRSNYT